MVETDLSPASPECKAAAITFVVINGLSVLMGLLCVLIISTSALGDTSPDAVLVRSLHSLYVIIYLAASAYALVIGCLVLARRAPNFWMSGPVVSIVAGALGMIMLLLHLPVSVWLIVAIKRLRRRSTAETPS